MISTFLIATAIGSWISIAGGAWQPSAKELDSARSGLQSYVSKTAVGEKLDLPEWPLYTFQYQGRTLDNKRFIFINAFCIAPPEYSTEQFVQVLDGGTCFFSVKYDPKTKTYSKLAFNGHG